MAKRLYYFVVSGYKGESDYREALGGVIAEDITRALEIARERFGDVAAINVENGEQPLFIDDRVVSFDQADLAEQVKAIDARKAKRRAVPQTAPKTDE